MDDNTFECPNCGAKIYPEMTRCPQCGQNMYPEDEEAISPIEGARSTTGWAGIGGVLIGWMIACGIALMVHIIIAAFVSPSRLGVVEKITLLLSSPIGVFVGSYVAAGILHVHSKLNGAIIAILALPIMVLFATHWEEVNLSFLLNPWVILVGLTTLFAGLAGGWVNYKFSQDTGWKEKWQVRGWEDLLYQELLRKVRFNGSAADRLIEYERQRDPQASRLKLIQNAIERWERDNR